MKSDGRKEKQLEDTKLTRRKAIRKVIRYSLFGIVGGVATTVTPKRASAGYGQCSVSGCYCQGYIGSGPLCQNCGHQYGLHW
jgi:hypothetical protein